MPLVDSMQIWYATHKYGQYSVDAPGNDLAICPGVFLFLRVYVTPSRKSTTLLQLAIKFTIQNPFEISILRCDLVGAWHLRQDDRRALASRLAVRLSAANWCDTSSGRLHTPLGRPCAGLATASRWKVASPGTPDPLLPQGQRRPHWRGRQVDVPDAESAQSGAYGIICY